ncbi:LacI family DNA-binding transcriptional regulator [Blastococcus sp. URHD0036]|uniref:LacI family DNA-binding transcriptional regulator n=1 Tax=Blastococcus sp. URHD0036 TaxID=1380356 RepID=UPI0009DD44C8|nr:LacI family DNA-binding transcriptional regulator [Blastococcus sp. URHD0036]
MTATPVGRRPATSYDVAARAGVSRSTVSFILNGNDARFPESTRQRVLDAAKELAYQPSLAGRSLASGRSDTIVVLLPNSTFGSNLQDVVDEVMVGTRAVGGNVVVRFAGNTPSATMTAILALRPAGVIDLGVLSADERLQLEGHGIIALPDAPPGTARDGDGGISEIQARTLLESGCRTLWFAALADQRLDAYGPGRLAALRAFAAGEGLPEPAQVRVPLDLTQATVALGEVLAGDDVPVGVACYNDEVALALLAAARELDVAVPDRLALVGVDHIPVGQLWSPPLTTVDVDLRGMVSAIASQLRALLGDGEAEQPVQASPFLTLVRGGTA